jgi:uncharacterized protein YciI
MANDIRKLLLLGALGFAALLAAQMPMDSSLAPYVPTNMKPYYLDLLLLKDKPETGLPEGDRMQGIQKHLAYIREQVERGNIVLVGPLQEENRLRGIAVIKASSLDEAQRVASGDPMVQTGHFTAEVHPILLQDLSSVRFDYPEKPSK